MDDCACPCHQIEDMCTLCMCDEDEDNYVLWTRTGHERQAAHDVPLRIWLND